VNGWTVVDWTDPREPCPCCGTFLLNVAHLCFAQALARLVLKKHLDEHNCGTGDPRSPDYVGGFLHCPVAADLWHRQSIDDRVVLA
jgi:hypothetical protein